MPYVEYQRANPTKFCQFFKFAFVRNPWDRLVSTYFFLNRGGLNEMDRAWAERTLARYDDFDTFASDWLTPANAASWVHFQPQSDFILDDTGKVMVDLMGCFENIYEDFAFVARRLGRDAYLPATNRSTDEHFSTYYTMESSDAVAGVYARDVMAFGYRPTSANSRAEA